jgi:hypothetical protein
VEEAEVAAEVEVAAAAVEVRVGAEVDEAAKAGVAKPGAGVVKSEAVADGILGR